MKGQAHTVMQMLVWAVFATVFLVAVFSAYNFLIGFSPPVYLQQIRDLVSDAWKGKSGGFSTPVVAESVSFPAKSEITADYIKKLIGEDVLIEFKCGGGFVCENGYARCERTIKALVGACCIKNRSTCIIYLNYPPPPTCK